MRDCWVWGDVGILSFWGVRCLGACSWIFFVARVSGESSEVDGPRLYRWHLAEAGPGSFRAVSSTSV